MKIQIASDIHLEFYRDRAYMPPRNRFSAVEDRDLLILAGDIGVNMKAEKFVREQIEISPVIYVPGNHEYYAKRKREYIDAAWKEIAEDNYPNLFYAVDDLIQIGEFTFWGAPWYSDLWGDDTFRTQSHIRNSISDFRYWNLDDHVEQHNEQTWAITKLAGQVDVVITHWPPTKEAIHPRYEREEWSRRLNPYFINDKEDVVREVGAKLWVSGHTHEPYDYVVGTTRCIANPSGYAGETHESDLFRPDKLITI